jgi:hypothetical protein
MIANKLERRYEARGVVCAEVLRTPSQPAFKATAAGFIMFGFMCLFV